MLTSLRAVAGIAAGQPGETGEPLLHLVVEAVLRLARLQVEEAQHQRARQTEQRRAERGAHARHRRRQPGLELVEHHHEIALADREAVDHLADRADRLEQAPEGAEQAEEDQKADLVARDVAPLVEPGADAVQQIADRHRRQHRSGPRRSCSPSALGDRRQQPRRRLQREARLAGAEGLDPADLRLDADDAPEDVDDADQQDPEDQAIEHWVVEEDPQHDVVGEGDREGRQHQEDDHAVDETLRTGHRRAFPTRLRPIDAAMDAAHPPAARRRARAGRTAARRWWRLGLETFVNTKA